MEYEFHGDIENDKSGFFETYEKKSADNANGSFTAPFEDLRLVLEEPLDRSSDDQADDSGLL